MSAALKLCPTCGRRASERVADNAAVWVPEPPCTDPIHDLADRAPALERLVKALKLLADDHEFGEVGHIRQEHLAAARAALAEIEAQ